MSAKRKRGSSSPFLTSEPKSSPKRLRPPLPDISSISSTDNDSGDGEIIGSPPSTSRASVSRIDPIYGQRGAFPGLESDETPFYGPAGDGLEYLRMVRTEAKGVPNILVASGALFKDSEHEDSTTYNGDDTFAAVSPASGPSSRASSPESSIDAQEAYYRSLKRRFTILRALHQTPVNNSINDHQAHLSDPVSSSTTLAASSLESRSTMIPSTLPGMRANYAQWHFALLYTQPSTKALSSAPHSIILRALTKLERVLANTTWIWPAGSSSRVDGGGDGVDDDERMNKKKPQRQMMLDVLGAWCWGLLGCCRGPEEMVSEEVGMLRELGLRALWCAAKLKAGKGKWARRREAPDPSPEDLDADMEGRFEDKENENQNEEIRNENADELDGTAEDAALEQARRDMLAGLEPCLTNVEGVLPQHHIPINGTQGASEMETTEIQAQGADPGKSLETKSMMATRAQSDAEWLEKALAMLDVVVTLVGEFWGQKDLLDLRAAW